MPFKKKGLTKLAFGADVAKRIFDDGKPPFFFTNLLGKYYLKYNFQVIVFKTLCSRIVIKNHVRNAHGEWFKKSDQRNLCLN